MFSMANHCVPAVIGMEAMVQVAMAIRGEKEIPTVKSLHFERPISGRVWYSRHPQDFCAGAGKTAELTLSYAVHKTSFQLDHFRCFCVFGKAPLRPDHMIPSPDVSRLPVESSARDLYGKLALPRPSLPAIDGLPTVVRPFLVGGHRVASASSMVQFVPA